MKVLLRADASPDQGTGHVMRCLTLAEELLRRGNEVVLMTCISNVEWLEKTIIASKIHVVRATQDELSVDDCLALSPDLVVTDSYEIPPGHVSELSRRVPVLAIVDGDTRKIVATEYLDHNLGAESVLWPDEVSTRILAGSKYSLIRDDVIARKRSNPWLIEQKMPHVVAVMGGTDPTGAIVDVSMALFKLQKKITATVVVSNHWFKQVDDLLGDLAGFEIIRPTSDLPKVFASADIAISASGTTAWELCSLGIPSLLIAVVENQSQSLQQLVEKKLVLGIDLCKGGFSSFTSEVETKLLSLFEDSDLRKQLSLECATHFDGLGKVRVVDFLETMSSS